MVNVFKVIYHFEVGGRMDQGGGVQMDHVAATSGDASSLGAVLTAAGKGPRPGRVLVFDLIANAGLGAFMS